MAVAWKLKRTEFQEPRTDYSQSTPHKVDPGSEAGPAELGRPTTGSQLPGVTHCPETLPTLDTPLYET
jgi:hypothetical protein